MGVTSSVDDDVLVGDDVQDALKFNGCEADDRDDVIFDDDVIIGDDVIGWDDVMVCCVLSVYIRSSLCVGGVINNARRPLGRQPGTRRMGPSLVSSVSPGCSTTTVPLCGDVGLGVGLDFMVEGTMVAPGSPRPAVGVWRQVVR